MKAALVLLALVAAASSAQFTVAPAAPCDSNAFVCLLKNLGSQLKDTFKNIGDSLKEVGTGLLSQVASTGADLVSTGAKALAGTLSSSLPGVGRRSLMEAGAAVAGLHQFVGKLKAGYTKAVDGLVTIAHKLASFQLGGDIHKDISDLVDEFKALTHHAEVERRSILDDFKNGLSSWKTSIGDFLKPHVDNVVNAVSSLGGTLKGHASNLLDTLKNSAATLGDKLKEHATTLSGHAQTALEQLKASVTDILAQTAGQVGGTLGTAASDVATAAGNAVGDVATAAGAAAAAAGAATGVAA